MTAAKGLLKLYSNESLVPFISPLQISQLSLVIQDPVFRVRQIFVEKLCQFLQLQKIPFDFIALLPLIAHEPEHELKNMVMRFLSKMARQQRIGEF